MSNSAASPLQRSKMTSPPLCADSYAWAKTVSPASQASRQTSSLGQFGACRSS